MTIRETVAIREFLTAVEAVGWQLVPDEATAAMTVAGWYAALGPEPPTADPDSMRRTYRAMLAAAPRWEATLHERSRQKSDSQSRRETKSTER